VHSDDEQFTVGGFASPGEAVSLLIASVTSVLTF
jgi:hypothetical protein